MELKITGLTKRYGSLEALKGLDLTLHQGIYGILGPNGAGKSTLMNLVVGNLTPTAGTITLDGEEIASMGQAYRRRLGYMPQQQVFYPNFTGRRFLNYIAALRGMDHGRAKERTQWVLEQLGLSQVSDRPIGSWSGGMRQRLLLAQALLDDPDILVLDEPTTGLDPWQRLTVRNLIGKIGLNKIVALQLM